MSNADLIKRAEDWLERLRPSDLGANGPMFTRLLIGALRQQVVKDAMADIKHITKMDDVPCGVAPPSARKATDFERLFRWLNEADANADKLYELAKKAGAKGFELNHPAHRIASCLSCVRHVIEAEAGRPLNSSRSDGGTDKP